MRLEFPSDAAPLDAEWLDPLLAAVPHLPDEPPFSFFDPGDFMVMGRVRRRGHPPITLYKHIHTRRYLNLDPQGRAYRYVPPLPWEDGEGRYRRLPSLLDGMEHLDLAELPWLKPGLEAFQVEVPRSGEWEHEPSWSEAIGAGGSWCSDGWWQSDDAPDERWWDGDELDACARYERAAQAARNEPVDRAGPSPDPVVPRLRLVQEPE